MELGYKDAAEILCRNCSIKYFTTILPFFYLVFGR
jgi:hypothetical protein